MIEFLKNLETEYFSIIGGVSFILFKWAIKSSKKKSIDRIEISLTAIGSILFVPMGHGFITMICALDFIDRCMEYYIDAKQFWFLLFGALFGTFLFNAINLCISIMGSGQKWVLNKIGNGKG